MILSFVDFDQERIWKILSDIRFADIVTCVAGRIDSVRMPVCLDDEMTEISFHVPKARDRLGEGYGSENRDAMLKFTTDYAEVSSEWCINTKSSMRIPTIIGCDIHVRGKFVRQSRSFLLSHLSDVVKENSRSYDERFCISQLDETFLEEHLEKINGYKVLIDWENTLIHQHTLEYRDDEDKLATAEMMEKISDVSNPRQSTYRFCAKLLRDSIE